MVAFQELQDSPQIKTGRDGQASATRHFLLAWADIASFEVEFRGGYKYTNGQTFLYPPGTMPGFPDLYVSDVSYKPFVEKPQTATVTVSGTANSHEWAEAVVNYSPVPPSAGSGNASYPPNYPSVPDGTFLELGGDFFSEILTIPGRFLKWSTSGVALAEDSNTGIQIGGAGISMRWTRVPRPPWSALDAAVGKCNSAAFLGKAAKKVIFQSYKPSVSVQLNSTCLWTLEYSFRYRQYEWDKLYDKTTNGFDTVKRADDAALLESTDFAPLFQFGN